MTIYSLTYSFSNLELVCCSMSGSNCCFLTCIQISQRQVKWSGIPISWRRNTAPGIQQSLHKCVLTQQAHWPRSLEYNSGKHLAVTFRVWRLTTVSECVSMVYYRSVQGKKMHFIMLWTRHIPSIHLLKCWSLLLFVYLILSYNSKSTKIFYILFTVTSLSNMYIYHFCICVGNREKEKGRVCVYM